MKNTLIVIAVIIVIGLGAYFYMHNSSGSPPVANVPSTTDTSTTTPTTGTPATPVVEGSQVVIGKSVSGRDIVAYNYGQGDKRIVFVGGIHGGYSWNTSLVAYQLMDYLQANPSAIPSNEKVTVIPVLNPDGLHKVVSLSGEFTAADITASQSVQISGRYNADNVDLNRNFDCDWQSSAKWQNTTVSGGSAAFSEPETLAMKNYVDTHPISAAVVWYSAAGGVYASSCGGSVLPETTTLTNIYAKASGYPAYQSFDFYETTGDMVNWLAKNTIPAISVLLTNHTDTEWTKNKAGITAVLNYYAK